MMKKSEERMKWFHQARFGMFIHWGLYSLLGRGEWVMLVERIPVKEYEKLAWEFKPKKFDPDEWVSLAKEAGMKYVVFTTRHHDGFCLFDSKVSDFTSVKTAAKRDFVREYVKAVRKAGLKVGLYYSLLDWRFPGYFNWEKYPESKKALVQQAHSQVKELMTNYGKIDYLFYDGAFAPGLDSSMDKKGNRPSYIKFWDSEKLNKMVRKLQPHIIINNRAGLAEDLDTPEQEVKPSPTGRAWECCMTIGSRFGWGYIKNDPSLKTVPQLIENLVTCAAGEGNYLLNIGPKPDGTVKKEEVLRLKEIGKRIKINGESIYGSKKASIPGGMVGVFTAKGNTSYLHVFRWPGKEIWLSRIKNKIKSASLLGTNRKLYVSQYSQGRVRISGLPEKPPDKYWNVVKIKMQGKSELLDLTRIPIEE